MLSHQFMTHTYHLVYDTYLFYRLDTYLAEVKDTVS